MGPASLLWAGRTPYSAVERGKTMQRGMIFAGVVLFCLTIPHPGLGQAGNHWTEQFGNRSMLLSGAVIGSVSDLGLVFYNPARLALVEKPAFVVTAKAYQWDQTRLEDGLGEGVDLKDSRFGGAPTLAAGAFNLPFLEGHRFAYAFLTRNKAETDAFLRTERRGDLLEQFPGEEFFSGTVNISSALKEEWVGVTWAHNLGEDWSLGLSSFYYNLKRKSLFGLDLAALTEAGDVLLLSGTRMFSYQDQGVLWKAGVAGVFHPVSVGVTLTSPRVSVLAKGRIQYEEIFTGGETADPPFERENRLITTVQSGLPAVIRSPWAVGGGIGVEWGRATLHVSGEWYSSLPKYTVTAAKPFEGQSTGEMIEYRVVEELESVLNGAVGIEWHRGETLSLFGSAATNQSAAPKERASFFQLLDEVSTAQSRVNYPQVAGGFVISTSYIDLTLGASYSWAKDRLNRPLNLPDGDDDPIVGGEETSRYLISRWRILLGFSFPFADDLRDRGREDVVGNGGL
jgi:hypothetical protein